MTLRCHAGLLEAIDREMDALAEAYESLRERKARILAKSDKQLDELCEVGFEEVKQ